MTGSDSCPPSPENPHPASEGLAAIKAALKTFPGSPGVYRMLSEKGEVLYVGKANNLAKRVASYTRLNRQTNRIRRMVAETAAMEIVTTHTEIEALLLESNLIKKLGPRYNVLLRDDKSFPYIFISDDHDWPQITKHRGAQSRKGDYFGPFATVGAVNETLTTLERAFLLRSCSDNVFTNRQRPCLLYQIKRCSAPCVERITTTDYAALVRGAKDFLSGRSQDTQKQLVTQMEAASADRKYELAALYRDRIEALAQVQSRQDINLSDIGDADVIALHQEGGQSCIQVFFFRSGHNYGNRAYYPRHDSEAAAEEVLKAFLGQFYDSRPAPRTVLLTHAVEEHGLIEDALSLRADHRVTLSQPKRGSKRKIIDHAQINARNALARKLSENASQRRLLEGLAETLGLEAPPERIEVYDNSHIRGTMAVGGMIVAGPEGFLKNAYRRFNIRNVSGPDTPEGPETIVPGDDYGMMREVLTRRFTRALKDDPDRQGGTWPDLVLIDGGAGHLSAAQTVLADLGIEGLPTLAIAKGPERNAGRERFFMTGTPPFSLEKRDPVLYFLQRLRDEAHRYAIGSHRSKRSSAISRSVLDEIPGIGSARKRALLLHFGSARNVSRAGLADLEKVPGISHAMAKKIYGHFHDNG
ncbi:MAG: excinuclease ABC subunit UvrC [Rhodospirillaceae bacterium]|nr:excinuclease ABC subunit UvrC [Rhodospirillaceae bacterium]MBT5752921.1 excinuclease ABC subunit UvrC [Rhodospirillaceae bacterium]